MTQSKKAIAETEEKTREVRQKLSRGMTQIISTLQYILMRI